MTTILVVDDSMVSRMMIKAIIKEYLPDAFIIEAGNGEEALEKAGKSDGIDIALVDYNMPGITGLELFKQLQLTLSITQRALLTANIQDAIRIEAEAFGVIFLNKPINEKIISMFLLNKPVD